LHGNNLILLVFIVTCLFNQYLKWFNVKILISLSILCKVIISILGCIFVFFNWNVNILYIVIFIFITYSFIISKEKKKFIYKLIFLIGFWNSFTIIFNMVWFNVDSAILNNIMLIYLANYIDQYSDLNPSNSKHVLDALHNLLKELNIHDLFPSGGGGNNSGPFFFPLITDTDEKDFSYLIKTSEKPRWDSFPMLHNFLSNSDEVKIIIEKIDNHNKRLVYPGDKYMHEEKNLMTSFNRFLDFNFHSPYGLASIHKYNNDLNEWLPAFKRNILMDVEKYNKLLICKYYYENKDKDSLPDIFKNFWERWHNFQINIHFRVNFECEKYLESRPYSCIQNFFRKDVVYGELNDNILIIGAGILCKIYIYTNMYDNYHSNLNVSKVEFFTKGWAYYQEALQKYYPFFHHYNWFCKLYQLKNSTEFDIFKNIYNDLRVKEKVASIPPLFEDVLEWPIKPEWYNDIRPPMYKKDILLYKKGLNMAKPFTKWTDFKDFHTKQSLGFLKYIQTKQLILKNIQTKQLILKNINTTKLYFEDMYNKQLITKNTKQLLELNLNKQILELNLNKQLLELNFKQVLELNLNKQFNINKTNITKESLILKQLVFKKIGPY